MRDIFKRLYTALFGPRQPQFNYPHAIFWPAGFTENDRTVVRVRLRAAAIARDASLIGDDVIFLPVVRDKNQAWCQRNKAALLADETGKPVVIA